MARFGDPGLRDARHVPTRGVVQRPPEISGDGARFAEALEVETDAVAEGLRAEIALDHAKVGGALLIGDRVDTLDRRLGRGGRGVDRMRRGKGGERETSGLPGGGIGPYCALPLVRAHRLVAVERRAR